MRLESKTFKKDIREFIVYDGNNADKVVEFTNMKIFKILSDGTLMLNCDNKESFQKLRIHQYDYVTIDTTGDVHVLSANDTHNLFKIVQ